MPFMFQKEIKIFTLMKRIETDTLLLSYISKAINRLKKKVIIALYIITSISKIIFTKTPPLRT